MYQVLKKTLLELHLNGDTANVAVKPSDTLLDVLRNQLGLTGTKNSCENGDCSACTVLIDGRPVKACLMLAVEAVGHEVVTIEGLRDTPIQKAFLSKFALQCGFYTPGFIVNSHALVTLHPDADDGTLDEWLQSNICRCTGYSEIKSAVRSVIEANRLKS